jgi:hypothetical protein
MTEDTKVTVTVTTKKLTVFMALDKQDHKIARQLLKASEFGREEKWTAFVEYCERIGVDGCEMCQWTHELLDTEYNMGYKDRIEILRIRDHILDSWNIAQAQLLKAISSNSNDGGKL